MHADEVEDLFMAVKELFLTVHDLVDASRALTFCSATDTRGHLDVVVEATEKTRKIIGYVTQTANLVFKVGEEADKKSFLANRTDDKATRVNDNPTRPPKGRKDPARKPFSFEDLVAGD